APGVSQSRGTSHNSVVVEMEKYLVVFDAPIGEPLSEWMIRASKQRYPGKPIGFLMLTHHHWDHASGARTYAAEGATVIVGKGNKEHFERMFSAPGGPERPAAPQPAEGGDHRGKRKIHAQGRQARDRDV